MQDWLIEFFDAILTEDQIKYGRFMLRLKLIIIAFLILTLTDTVWLGFIAKNWYIQYYEPWLRSHNGELTPIWWAAGLVYFLFSLAIVVFVVPLAQGSIKDAATYGAVLGFIIYGIYNFTCFALIEDWHLGLAAMDIVWGTVLCCWVSIAVVTFQPRVS